MTWLLIVVPGFVEMVRQYTLKSAHKRQPVLSLAGAMSLLAVLLGNRVYCEQGCWTNLLMIMVGATGCGKDRPRRSNNEILASVDAPHLLSCENPASGPAVLRAMEDHPVQLAQIDEFGRFLSTARDARSNAHSVVSEIMKPATSPGQTIRKPYSDTKKTFRVDNPLLVLLGATTPDALFEAVSDSSLQDGFIPRLDIFVGEDFPEPTGFRANKGVPGDIVDMAGAYLDLGPDELVPGERPPVRLEYDRKASRLFTDYQRYCAEEQRIAIQAGDVWTRSARKAATYAVLYSMSGDPKNRVLTATAMEWGIEVQKRLTHQLGGYLAKWCASTPFDRRQKALLRKVQMRGGWMTRRQIIRSSQHLRPREREEVLDNLVETNQLREIEIKRKRKPVEVYFDPKLTNEAEVTEQLRKT